MKEADQTTPQIPINRKTCWFRETLVRNAVRPPMLLCKCKAKQSFEVTKYGIDVHQCLISSEGFCVGRLAECSSMCEVDGRGV